MYLLPRKLPRDGAMAYSNANTALMAKGTARAAAAGPPPASAAPTPGPCPGERRRSCRRRLRLQPHQLKAALISNTPSMTGVKRVCGTAVTGEGDQTLQTRMLRSSAVPAKCPRTDEVKRLSLRWRALARLARLLRANRKQWSNKYLYFHVFALQAKWRHSTQYLHQDLINYGNNRLTLMNTFTFSIFSQASDLAKLL